MSTPIHRYKIPRSIKRYRLHLFVVVAMFMLLNLAVGWFYRARTYPRTVLGNRAIGSVRYGQLAASPTVKGLLPTTVTFQHKDLTLQATSKDLGVALDVDRLKDRARTDRGWLPLVDLFRVHRIAIPIRVQADDFQKQFPGISQKYTVAPQDARVANQQGVFTIIAEQYGRNVSEAAVRMALVRSLEKGSAHVAVPTGSVTPTVTTDKLTSTLKAVQSQQQLALTYQYEGRSKKLTAAEIAAWYDFNAAAYTIADAKINATLAEVAKGFGIRAKNLAEAVAATKGALQNGKPLSFTFTPAPVAVRAYGYCVAVRGVDAAYIPELSAKLQAVYADARGWGLSGQVSLVPVASGCSFTVWLAAADQMPTFGAICDSLWSCRVGTNVVINFDRWRLASDSWNKSGGSLEDYRVMVINHETGHWFGFNHSNCPGAGQAAPVMQQQSIDLQGCVFSPWPTVQELAALKRTLGI